jgi:hypothetical protein
VFDVRRVAKDAKEVATTRDVVENLSLSRALASASERVNE